MEVLINNLALEVSGVPVEVDLSNSTFDEEAVIKAYKTNKLDIPATPNNTAILTRLQELNSGGYSAGVGTIRGNGVDFSGRVKLYPATTTRGKSVMPIQVISGNGDWVKELEGEMLNEVDLSSLSHLFTRANIIASESGAASFALNYLYDLIDRGDGFDSGEWALIERFPAVRMTYLLIQIFKDKGIRVQSNTLGDGYLNRLFYIFCQPNDLDTIEGWNQELFIASGLPAPYNAAAVIGTSQFGGVTWYTPAPGLEVIERWGINYQTVDVNDGDHYTDTTGVYTINDNQAVSTKLKGSLRYKVERANTTSTFFLYVTIQIRQGSVGGTVIAESSTRFNPSPTQYYTSTVETGWFRPTSGQTYYLVLQYRGVLSTGTQLKLIVDTSTPELNFFKNFTQNWYAENDTVNFADILPKNISKLDYIKSMAKDFDLLFDYQPDTRLMRIENRAKYFDTVYRNFEGIIDADQPITVDHVVEEVGTSITLITKNDSGDKTPGYFKSTIPYIIDTQNVYGYKTGATTRVLSWSDTVLLRQSRLSLGTVQIPTMWKDGKPVIEDGVQQFSKFTTSFEQRVLYYSGRGSLSRPFTFDGVDTYSYPIMQRVTPSEVVTKYWNSYLWQLRNAKRLTFSAYISGIVVNRLINSLAGASMRTPIAVNIPKIAQGVFMIEKIDGYSLDKRGLCTVQLVELPPVRRAVNVSSTAIDDVTLINGGSLSINTDGDVLSLQLGTEILGEIPVYT